MVVMKLTIKHLAGYLPYGLEIRYVQRNENHDLEYHNIMSICADQNHLKPILRSLSDITKEHVSTYILEKIKNCSSKDIRQCLSHKEMDCLLEMHFDIYRLIENGLAIDINTL